MGLLSSSDINTAEYWDSVWSHPESINGRRYPGTFDRIAMTLYGFSDGDPLSILEVGCGVGVLAERICAVPNLVGQYMGVDISQKCLSHCRERILTIAPHLESSVWVHPVDMNTGLIPLEPQWADATVCTETMEHIREDTRAVSAMYDMTRPGGYLLISVPDSCLSPSEEPEHLRAYDTESFARLFADYAWIRGMICSFEETFSFLEYGQEKQISRPTLLFVGQRD